MNGVIICRCEEVDLVDIKRSISSYGCSAREVKLRTRAGMGYCGGRTCRSTIDMILKEEMGKVILNDFSLKVQPPVRPVSLAYLGGKTKDE